MQTIAILNQKGGVGKTTTAMNLGAGLAKMGKRVMLIDMDPQANLTYSLGIFAHELNLTIYDLLKCETTLEQVMIDRNGLKIVPASLDLSGADIEFSSIPSREFLLHKTLNGITDFEFILIDCPPTLSLLTLNALTAVQQIWIPLQTEFLPLQGLSKLLQTVDIVIERLNSKLEITGIICTRFDGRKNLNKEVVEKVKEHFGSKVFKTLIRENISLAEAPSFGQTIFEYKPDSYGAEDYLKLTKEIIERG